MKKLLLVLLAAVLIVGCQKKEVETTTALQDVSFKAIEITPDPGLKSADEDFPCKENEPTHAWVEINGTDDYYPELFELGGQLYTQAIKLAVGNYDVTNFVLYEEVDGVEGIGATDVIVFATPIEDNDPTKGYDIYVDPALPYNFDVAAFTKAEILLEVLCFEDAEYFSFGFDWFAVTQIVIRQACFFGDICIEDFSLYSYSIYDDQENGVQADEEAVIRVIVKEGSNEVPYSPFDNIDIYGTGEPLCVDYPDNLSVEETFTFELQVWVPSLWPGIFVWQTYATYTTIDDNPLVETDNDQNPATDNDDGVVDFAIGDCSPDSYPVYVWLDPIAPQPVVVTEDDLATNFGDVIANPTKWFFYNDETDVIDISLGSFVAGPSSAPAGTGSVEISVTGTERVCLATYQFAGIPLATLTTFAFSTYNPSAGNGGSANRSGYLNFNVDFDGSDSWQKRLVYVPSDNGPVTPDSWQEWDVIDNGNSLWRWSGNLWGGPWPDGLLNPVGGLATLDQILAAYPGVRIRVSDPFVGIRVGEPYADGYTENLDAFKIGVGTVDVTFDFEN